MRISKTGREEREREREREREKDGGRGGKGFFRSYSVISILLWLTSNIPTEPPIHIHMNEVHGRGMRLRAPTAHTSIAEKGSVADEARRSSRRIRIPSISSLF